MHNARQVFIKSQSDERLRQALRLQVWTSSETKYVIGIGNKGYLERPLEGTSHSS